ncbi:MAG: type II secretion system protein, partial [Amphiplicatus sp.]
MKRYTNKRSERGLTLFELLVVLAILAFLATL